MTNDQLLMLEAIVKAGSFKAASTLLHKSQPSLSVGIKKIEEEFGIELFSRDGYRPVLTPEGKAFYQRALLSLDSFRSLENFASELGKGVEPQIHLALDALCPIGEIRSVLKDLFFDGCTTSLELSVENLTGSTDRVKDGEVDLAIAPIFNEDPELETVPILEICMLPVINPELLGESELSFHKLQTLPQIVVRDSSKRKSDISAGLLRHGKKWYTDDNATKRELIIQGLGWGRLPSHSIQKELKESKLIPIEMDEVKPGTFNQCLIRHQSRARGPVARKLWDRFIELKK